MQVNAASLGSTASQRAEAYRAQNDAKGLDVKPATDQKELREKFDTFVGETFYKQMLSSMRKTVDKGPYFHGGQAEEVFQSQLDQVFSEQLSKQHGQQFSGPMFELFALQRS